MVNLVASWAVSIVEVKVLLLKPEEEKDKTHFTDKEVRSKHDNPLRACTRILCGFPMFYRFL